MRRVVCRKAIIQWTLLGLGFAALTGCELSRGSRPSILVVAVEGLSFDTKSCDAEELQGLRAFCDESVRFSHAFTPSTMSQAAIASLLTGLYPFDHGVRHNGDNFLSAGRRKIAEAALANRYRTLFVSGGPPIWRKSGLTQGFEIFDDVMDLGIGVYYRPAGEVFKVFTQWGDQLDDGAPFLSVLYLADLQFPSISTRTNDGEVREKSFAAQLSEVDESLDYLVRWLKDNRRWHSTNIVVVGLGTTDHPADPLPTAEPMTSSLRSKATQVLLFMKPARKERDNVIQWAVDRNVSLVDVGHTMFQWLGETSPASSLAPFQPQSLISALSEPEPNWEEGRLLLSETAWPDWLEGAGTRWALRQNQFLYIHDEKPLIFNTLTDRMENLPLKTGDPLWLSLNGDVIEALRGAKVAPFKGMTRHWPEQLAVARELWAGDLALRTPAGGEPWAKWYLQHALANRRWRDVKRFSQEVGEPIGAYVAARQMGESMPMPRDPCVRLMLSDKGDKKAQQSECGDERVLALYAWKTARGEEEKAAAQERFTRLHAQARMDQEIGRLNYLNDLRWDVDRRWPEPPQTVDYLLTMKDYEAFAKRLTFISAKDGGF